jgi:hypothetical protein
MEIAGEEITKRQELQIKTIFNNFQNYGQLFLKIRMEVKLNKIRNNIILHFFWLYKQRRINV